MAPYGAAAPVLTFVRGLNVICSSQSRAAAA
jgi:hypothetical protein